MKKIFIGSNFVLWLASSMSAFALVAPTPVTCIKADSSSSGWVKSITLQNNCGSPVDLQQAMIEFKTSKVLAKGSSFWGDFGDLSYPENPVLTVNKDQVSASLNFPSGSWVNTSLKQGGRITVKFNGSPDTKVSNIAVYTNAVPPAPKQGEVDFVLPANPGEKNLHPVIKVTGDKGYSYTIKNAAWNQVYALKGLLYDHYRFDVPSITSKNNTWTGSAAPGQLTINDTIAKQVKVSYKSVAATGALMIKIVNARPTGVSTNPVFMIKDQTSGKVLPNFSVPWGEQKTLPDLIAGDEYQISASAITAKYTLYQPENLPFSVKISANKVSSLKATYKGTPVKTVVVKGSISSIPANEAPEITFKDNSGFSYQSSLHNGSYNLINLPVGRAYTVSAESVTHDNKVYTPTVSPQKFNLSTEPLSLSVVYHQNTATLFFSPYKDASINMNWNTYVIGTKVNGQNSSVPLLGDDKTPSQLLPGNKAVSLAFATGTCGSESWGGVSAEKLAGVNIPLFESKNINYVISTGGANGAFFCDSADKMLAFIKRYQSKNLVGIDFDIEGGYNQNQLNELMHSAAEAQKKTHVRFSLTLATLGIKGGSLNSLGQQAIEAANKAGLDYDVNLMVMDYGSYGCTKLSGKNKCDMGASAITAANEVSKTFKIPFSRIELTPMIAQNDVLDEFTTLDNIKTIAQFAVSNHLAGLHYWSFDRDTPCSHSYVSPTCSSSSIPALAFDKAFLSVLN